MKRIVLILLFTVFIYCKAKAQTSIYHPFPDSNAVWNVSVYCPLSGTEDYSYTFDGDTAINGVIYHKMVVPNIIRTGICTNLSEGYFAGVRQDMVLRMVYYIISGDSVEKVLFNFDLQVGDSFAPALLRNCFHARDTVVSIDSILIGATYRKRWGLGLGLSIIEGIGYQSGLFEACGYSDLVCFQQNGQNLYPDSTGSCNLILGTSSIANGLSACTFFPNPFHMNAILKIDAEYLGAKMIMYNVIGDKIREYILNSSENVIERGNLIAGIYFYKIENFKHQSIAGKFLVN